MSEADTPLVGPGIRRRRRALEMTLAEVAGRAGLSVPFLSQIENGRSRPSMGSLQRIADALGTSAVQLLSTAEAPRPVDVVRHSSAAVRETGPQGESDGRMRPLVRGHQRLHALEFTGAHDWGREFRHRNDEILYVADGSAEVEADGNFYRLEQGDTLYCAGGLVHRWRPIAPNTRVLVVGIADHVQATDEQAG
ncbi:helix-turn-helix domain-containing protein [Streptomyces sp. NBC_00264]|uniref:helix-turn-helix domain-containing protein n=1 Tax=unclassified Streptomyces TaxID=2593676 RepID=UPI00225C28EA|nr:MULTISPECIES: helix-turn-helix transcriptional regulator [unclassified Streptomyces]MCX4392445.1 helix-turn-helix domain-containing protein [Streptomyces sp. NBC_01767]MCX5164375.1 helix-turn-helix domain-containing protein [Streptomyces sp. NBC_00305]MCX5222899.1 helix-turn-helix domain-containing protein [Streptomyces sp. NBC_00264]WSC26467.1 helix-turn-helix domain-containing protein [Streptomyces sp. NBC_01768]